MSVLSGQPEVAGDSAVNDFYDTKLGRFYLGECLETMASFPDGIFDMVLCDLPYGTTNCNWDSIIPFEALWKQYVRLAKNNAPIVLTGSQPFTSALLMSQPKIFRYALVWDKKRTTNFAHAKLRPLKQHEDILIFSKGVCTYNPQMVEDGIIRKRGATSKASAVVCATKFTDTRTYTSHYPKSILQFYSGHHAGKFHPTQKPVALFEYLVKTYTNPGALVLDNCAGSGTTAVACENLGRRWVCIEREVEYFSKAIARLPKVEAEQVA